ncbi:hypothetical protein IMSHALPRED_002782 [Imshaugia aleurites]|uniref:Uncharacterized protein n=1 Tax=Imshaugia aleurites TaxID=172621 RepID=A0A8H3J6I4_9LECA|nr:hypothetical protein IMSHALPRED_002782 [Imshaugia aleurites]
MTSLPQREPKGFEMSDINMEANTVEEQITDTAESRKSDHKDSDEMDTGAIATDPTAGNLPEPEAASIAGSEKTLTIRNGNISPPADRPHGQSPAGEPDETGAIEDHNLDHLFQESCEKSTTSTNDTGPVQDSHETSSTSTDDSNPSESPTNSPPSNRPLSTDTFNLPACPPKVIHNILRFLLVSNHRISPYYNHGSLRVSDQEACERKNNPYTRILLAFAGNAPLLDAATTTLYGTNTFTLTRPAPTLWFLQRIGPTNTAKLRHLNLTLSAGPISHLGTRAETLWHSILLLLLPHPQPPGPTIQYLAISFKHWPDAAGDLDPNNDPDVWEPRYGVLRTLLRFRGLDEAVVTPGPYVNAYTADLLANALVMDPGETSDELREFEDDVKEVRGRRYLMDHPKGVCERAGQRDRMARCAYCGRGGEGRGGEAWGVRGWMGVLKVRGERVGVCLFVCSRTMIGECSERVSQLSACRRSHTYITDFFSSFVGLFLLFHWTCAIRSRDHQHLNLTWVLDPMMHGWMDSIRHPDRYSAKGSPYHTLCLGITDRENGSY